MNELIPQHLPPFLAAFFFILPFLSFYALWRIRRASGDQWLRWNRVPPLPLTCLEMLSILAIVWLASKFFAVFLPVIAIGCALFFTQRHGIILALQWGLEPARYPSCVRVAFNAYLACITPLLITATLSFLLCQNLGRTDLMQEAVKEFQGGDRAQMIRILLLATIYAPLWEEMFFRGILYPWLKSRTTQKAALLLSALFFAAIHWHLPSFLPLAVLGLTLALVYEYTGSLVASILLHALFNFATCLNLFLMREP